MSTASLCTYPEAIATAGRMLAQVYAQLEADATAGDPDARERLARMRSRREQPQAA